MKEIISSESLLKDQEAEAEAKELRELDPRLLDGHGNVLKVLDIAFGAFFLFLTFLTGVGYLRGEIAGQEVLALFFFSFINIIISRFSAKSVNPLRIELFRILILGNALAFIGFILIDAPLAPFWPLHLVMSVGCGILVFLQTKRQIISHAQTVIWLLNYAAATISRPEPANWYYFLGTSATIVCITALFTHLLATLAQGLLRETRAKAQLLEANKMTALGQMAGGVAHEINTPLAAILMKSEQMQELLNGEPIDKPTIQDMAKKIGITTKKIARIVSGLRTFSRDSSQDPRIMVGVQKIIGDTLALCSEKFKNNNIFLKVDAVDPSLSISCRETEISQVLLNLLNNASDAVSEHAEKWIKISVTESASHIELAVIDSGSGVPKSVRDKLFQPFFTTKEVGKGTGLGLSISKRIIENHRGKLLIDAEHPNTKFVIALPK